MSSPWGDDSTLQDIMRTFNSSTPLSLFQQAHCFSKALAHPAGRESASGVKLRSEVPTKLAFRIMLVLIATCAAFGAPVAAENIMIQEDNMKELNCSLPNEQYRLLRSNAPGQVFVGDEKMIELLPNSG